MDPELLEQFKEQMKVIVTGVVTELKEELKSEQQATMMTLETGIAEQVSKLSKKVEEFEKTLSATAFANRVFEDFFPPTCTSSPTSTVTSTTTSVASTVVSSSIATSAPLANATFLTVPNVITAPNLYKSPHEISAKAYPGPPMHAFHYPVLPVSNFEQRPSLGPNALPDFSHESHSAQGLGRHNCGPTSMKQALPGRNPSESHCSAYIPQPIANSVQHPPPATATSANSGAGNLVCNLIPFDGTVSWSDYRIQFEIVARNNGWTEQEKADAMATQLRGSALSVLSVFPQGHRIRYGELIDVLEQRFGVDSYSSQVQFCSRAQGVRESFANFALELQRLATAAFPSCPTEVVDRIAALRFLEGLRDNELRTFVRVRGPKTLHEAVNAAQELASRTNSGRNSRVYLAQESPPKRNPGRRRRQRGNNQIFAERDTQGRLGGPVASAVPNSSLLYGTFLPASQPEISPAVVSDSGNPSSSTQRGESR